MADHKTVLEFGLDSGSLNRMADAVDKSLSKPAKNFAKNVKKETADAIKAAMQVAASEGRIGREWNNLIKKPFRDIESEIQKALRAGDVARAQGLRQNLANQTKALQEELSQRKQAYQEIFGAQRKNAVEHAKMLESGADTLRNAISGGDFVNSIRQALESGGGFAQRLGKGFQGKAGEVSAAGGPQAAQQAQMFSKLGKTLSTVGKAAAGFAAVAGAVILLVKLFMDLESRARDANKAILSTASAADFGLGHAQVMAGDLETSVDRVRKETIAAAAELGVKADQLQAALGAFNEAGFTFSEMQTEIADTTNTMNNFADVANMAVTQSRMLGLSVQETAQMMGKFTVDTGMGLQDIAMQFSVISREAAAAGVNTKRFFETVSEVSSGMAFYGVRIEETARILSTFDSLLGETLGGDLFKQLTGKGKDMGAQQRIQEMLLKNPQRLAEAYAGAFASRQTELARDFGDDLTKVLGEGETLESFLQLDEQTIRDRLTGVLKAPEIERFTQASVLRRAGDRDSDAMQRARAFGGTGLDVRLAASATDVFGGKRIDEVFRAVASGELDRNASFAALEQVTGKSFDELEKLNTLFSNAEANLTRLREIAAKDPGLRDARDQAFLKAQEEMFGITEDGGEIKRGNQVIKDAVDFVAETQTKTEEELSKALSQDQQVAMEVRDTVTSIADTMDMVIAQILENIYSVVVDIYKRMVGSDQEALERAASEDEARRQALEISKAMTAGQDKLADLQQKQEQARASGDMQAVSNLESEIQAQSSHLETLAKKAEINEKIQREQASSLKSKSSLEAAAEKGYGSMEVAAKVTDLLGVDTNEVTALEAASRAGDGGIRDYVSGSLMASMDAQMMQQQQKAASLRQGNLGAAIFGGSAADLARQDLLKDKDLVKKLGGEEKLLALIAEAEQRGSERAEEQIGMFTSKDAATRIRTSEFKIAFEEALKNLQIDQHLEKTAKNTDDGFFGISGLFARAKQAQDLILPAGGGAPIITDSKDTVLATKPGGAIDRASQGRGGGGAGEINFYISGTPQEVYRQVLRVLKETGVA